MTRLDIYLSNQKAAVPVRVRALGKKCNVPIGELGTVTSRDLKNGSYNIIWDSNGIEESFWYAGIVSSDLEVIS